MYINVNSPGDALNLSNLLKDGEWMVLYYAEWCGHCKTMKPEWNKVVNKMKKHNNINIAEIESNHIDKLSNKPTIQGFPTIKMYNNGKEVANFEDERVADKMEKFALHNSNNSKNLKLKNFKSLKKINNKVNTTNTNNNIDLLPKENKNINNTIDFLPKENKNINNTHNTITNTITNIKTKECKKYVIPKQCKSIPDCTFDYKIKKCIVKNPKSIKKIIEEQPMMDQGMMEQPMIEQPMMDQGMMDQGVMVQGVMDQQPMMDQGMMDQGVMVQGVMDQQPMMDQTMMEQQPIMEQPMMEQPIMEQPMMEQPMMEQPMMEQPMMEQPMMEQPMMEPILLTHRNSKPRTLRRKTPTPRTTKPRTSKPKTLRRKTPTPRTSKPKTLRRKTPTPRTSKPITKKKNKNNYDLKKSTKSVFSKLINSFDRIGDEARKDAELLTEAKHLL